jgi:hypothetical protein
MSPSQPKKSQPNMLQRFLRWLFGTPFEDIGEPFGDPVPPETHKFEAEAEAITHMPRGDVMPKGAQHAPQTTHK